MSKLPAANANPSTRPNRLVRLYRFAQSHGLLPAAYRFAHRVSESILFRRWFRFAVVEVYSARLDELKQDGAIPRAFVVREALKEDEAGVEAYFDNARLVGNRFRRGAKCAITLAKGRPCAAVWFAAGPVEFHEDWDTLRCVFRIPAGAAWSFDGKGTRFGAWGSLMARFPGLVRQHGNQEVYTLIDYDNRPSSDAHRSLGYRRAGMLSCLSALGLTLRFYRPEGGRWRLGRGRIGQVDFGGKRFAKDRRKGLSVSSRAHLRNSPSG